MESVKVWSDVEGKEAMNEKEGEDLRHCGDKNVGREEERGR